MKKTKLLIAFAALISSATAFAQLVNTDRVTKHQWFVDDVQLQFGNLPDAAFEYDTAQTNDSLILGLPATNDRLVLTRKADMGVNFGLADLNSPALTLMSNGGDKSFSLYNDDTNVVLSNSTNGTFDFNRQTAGTITLTTSDTDSTSALSILPGGAAAMTIGGSSTTSITTSTDDTGDGEEVHVVNSVGPSELVGMYSTLMFCGENAENGTTYFGPATAPFNGDSTASYAQASTACDALDNTTEATADAPISALATKIHGMYCTTDGTLGASESIVFTLRTGAANAVTTDGSASTLTCTIGVGETACRANTATTTNIAAGATVAMQVVETSNNADDNAWCKVFVSYP